MVLGFSGVEWRGGREGKVEGKERGGRACMRLWGWIEVVEWSGGGERERVHGDERKGTFQWVELRGLEESGNTRRRQEGTWKV